MLLLTTSQCSSTVLSDSTDEPLRHLDWPLLCIELPGEPLMEYTNIVKNGGITVTRIYLAVYCEEVGKERVILYSTKLAGKTLAKRILFTYILSKPNSRFSYVC